MRHHRPIWMERRRRAEWGSTLAFVLALIVVLLALMAVPLLLT